MSKTERIERLLKFAQNRLAQAKTQVLEIEREIRELQSKLSAAREDDLQLSLPLTLKTKAISEKWGAVLNFIVSRAPHSVTLDDVMAFVAQNDLSISRASARAQLYNYVQKGLLTRITDGMYVATDAARSYCDF